MKIVIPDWMDVSEKINNEDTITHTNPLEYFIYHNEPADVEGSEDFRIALKKALEWVIKNK